MKKILVLLVLVALLAGISMAMELGGKTGFGLRAGSFSIRRFINNNWAVDLSGDYSNSTLTGQADSNQINGALGAFYAREIYPNTLLEIGAAVQNTQGHDGSSGGAFFSDLALNPFIGGEVFINDHVTLDGKLFIGAYTSGTAGGNRETFFNLLDGNLGAHIYL